MAGRGRGKTLPAWMTSGDASLLSSVPPAASTTVPGQFNDARQPFVDKFQAPQRDAPSTGQFQSSSSNNGREQYAAPSTFGSREPFQAPSTQRDAATHHGGAGQSGPGPAPPQGPPPRAMPGRYDMMQTNPAMMPPRPAMQMGQDYTSGKLPFIPQMSLAQGVGSGIAPMMGFQQPPHQLPQQLQQPQHLQPQQQLQQSHMFMPPHQQSMQQSLQQPIPLQMSMQMQMQNPSMPGMGMGLPLQQPVLSSVGRGLPLQQPGALPLGMSLGMVGGFPQPIGRGMPLALPRGPAPAPAPVAVGDPNNEVSSWSEHEAEDKRKYWYNRVNGTSTYDKPFCLKTPEERSIPPCKWKEYTAADGKKYYSDGKESSWSVPEEYRVWKEKMDAVERKKLTAFAPSGSANVHTSLTKTLSTVEAQSETAATVTANTVTSATAASLNGSSNSSGVNNTNGGANASSGSNNRKKQVEEEEKVVIVYATQEEAVEAFKSMLTERRVLTTMKMKEVIDLCQSDPRFNALKSGGEKKQALAEYQVRRFILWHS